MWSKRRCVQRKYGLGCGFVKSSARFVACDANTASGEEGTPPVESLTGPGWGLLRAWPVPNRTGRGSTKELESRSRGAGGPHVEFLAEVTAMGIAGPKGKFLWSRTFHAPPSGWLVDRFAGIDR